MVFGAVVQCRAVGAKGRGDKNTVIRRFRRGRAGNADGLQQRGISLFSREAELA